MLMRIISLSGLIVTLMDPGFEHVTDEQIVEEAIR